MAAIFLYGYDPEELERQRRANPKPGPVPIPSPTLKEGQARRLDEERWRSLEAGQAGHPAVGGAVRRAASKQRSPFDIVDPKADADFARRMAQGRKPPTLSEAFRPPASPLASPMERFREAPKLGQIYSDVNRPAILTPYRADRRSKLTP